MSIYRKCLLKWFPIATAITFCCVAVYLGTQQDLRQSANDPQIQMAKDAGVLLSSGQPPTTLTEGQNIEMEKSLSPFLIVYNRQGRPVASSGYLHGIVPSPPYAVFQEARRRGEERFTWEPARGVRCAAVIDYYKGTSSGFVLAGRSLELIETRERAIAELLAVIWAVALVVVYVQFAALEIFSQRRTDLL